MKTSPRRLLGLHEDGKERAARRKAPSPTGSAIRGCTSLALMTRQRADTSLGGAYDRALAFLDMRASERPA